MNNKRIYLAAPFAHWNPFIRFWRFYKVTKVATKLMKEGYIVFSPITHCYFMHVFDNMPGSWSFWRRQDESHLDYCDALYLLMLPGWQKSQGVAEELIYADAKFKEVVYLNYKEYV